VGVAGTASRHSHVSLQATHLREHDHTNRLAHGGVDDRPCAGTQDGVLSFGLDTNNHDREANRAFESTHLGGALLD
jgi:hypothetical protein